MYFSISVSRHGSKYIDSHAILKKIATLSDALSNELVLLNVALMNIGKYV